jgi:nitronate monooxygenase
MGVGVSGWRLARAVALAGQLGVVSGTALDLVLTRRLQIGDPGGHMRRALERFPVRGVAERILERYYVPGGKAADRPFRSKPQPAVQPSQLLEELLVASNFAEVFLAKEGHSGLVGINYLEKIQLPLLPSLYGAMLAGVDYVLMGAGIPKSVPGILDRLSRGEPVRLKVNVEGARTEEELTTGFDSAAFSRGQVAKKLARPKFLAIISSATLGTMLARRSDGRVDGFVVEGFQAGGHNAPPRGPLQLNAAGEPVYGQRDVADLSAVKAIGLPFWLAGGYATPHELAEASLAGAAGVQIGTAFAFCEESDLAPELKAQALQASVAGEAKVLTDPLASPTGFPFKVLQMAGTLSDPAQYEARPRRCDLGYLRQAYRAADGTLTWRCAAEPVEDFLAKGGAASETAGRKCLCNALMSNIGLGQCQPSGELEQPLITSGDDVAQVARFLRPGALSYRAIDVIQQLLPDVPDPDTAEQKVVASPAKKPSLVACP